MASLGILAGSAVAGALGATLFSKRKAEAKAEVESTIRRSIDHIFAHAATCSPSSSTTQSLEVKGSGEKVTDISQTQSVTVTLDCLQSSAVNEDVKTRIQQAMDQLARSITGSFGIGKQDTLSNTVTKFTTDLGTSISDTVHQTCAQKAYTTQSLTVDGKNNEVSGVTQKQITDEVVKCVNSSVEVNSQFENIMEEVKQQDDAKAKGFNVTGFLLIAAIVILVVFGISAGTKVLTNPAFLMLLVGLIGAAVWYFAFKSGD